MLPPDIMSQMGAPAGGGGGLPPDLAALMGGGGPAPEEQAPGNAGDPQAMYEAAMDATDDPIVLIDWALQAARKAATLESEPEDVLKLEKATTALAQYQADLQKESDAALGGQVSPKAVRKMAPAGGGY